VAESTTTHLGRTERGRPHALLEAAVDSAAAVDLSWVQPAPADHAWTLAPDALRLLTALVALAKPPHVLEFGAGLSTLVLARACRRYEPSGRLTSIENDPMIAKQTRRELEHAQRGSDVDVIHASLVLRHRLGRLLPSYAFDADRVRSRGDAGVVLVDGPPEKLGGREGAVYQALECSGANTIVLLDDADRAQESEILARLRDELREHVDVVVLDGFVRGLAAIVVRKPVGELPRHSTTLRPGGD
jgi:hypothetical protein